MPTVKVNDINMYYELHGEGEPLVLLMGGGGGSSLWWQQVEYLSPHYKVVTFDSRGVGATDKPDIPYTMEMLTDDVVGLLKNLEIGSAHIYGVSMGGMVAQDIVLRYPDMVISLILGASSCGGAHAIYPPQGTLQLLFDIQSLPPEEAAKVAASLLFSTAFVESNPGRFRELLAKGMESPASPQGFRRQAQATMGFDTFGQLPHIQVPTLVIAGTEDSILPAENSRILASRIPNAELLQFEGVGHGYVWEAADKANRAVLDFLRRQRQE